MDPKNRVSQRVAEKLSDVREGVLRQRFVVHDRPYDMIMFSLIPQDLV